MQIKTAELTGLALDWALADAMQIEKLKLVEGRPVYMPSCGGRKPFDHTDPATCMGLMACEYGKVWKAEAIPRTTTPTVLVMGFAELGADVTKANGQTLEEAVARCVVQMRLGDEVSVPDELVGVQG